MSRDWTPDELQAASTAMKAAGHMSYEEFCANVCVTTGAKSKARVYRVEYLEDRLGKWISFYEGADLEHVKTYLGTPIVGNPRQRVAAYDKSGVRKVKYSFVGVIE